MFDYLIATDEAVDDGENDDSDENSDDVSDDGDKDGEEIGDENEDEEDEEADIGDDVNGASDDEDDIEDNEEEEDEDEDDDDVESDELNSTDDEENADEDNDQDEEEDKKKIVKKLSEKSSIKNNAKSTKKSNGYGVARGIDFQGVSFVINFDFPKSGAAYTHRIGRTARGGAAGTALSFVCVDAVPDEDGVTEEEILTEVQKQQPRLGDDSGNSVLASLGTAVDMVEDDSTLQPAPLMFNMRELDSFRYRVEDTFRSVTNSSVREYRAAELKKEIVNSTKLKSFFASNPNDLKVRS